MELIDFPQPSDSLVEALSITNERIAELQSDPSIPRRKDELTKLLTRRARLEAQVMTAKAKEEREAQRAARVQYDDEDVRDANKAEIRTWLKANDYYYTHRDATYWLYTPGASEPWAPVKRSNMVNHDPRLDARGEYFDLFTEVLQEDGRWFRSHARTFESTPADVLNMLRWDFLKPTTDAEPSWVFDAILRSLGGNKAENIEHIERLIVAKYLHPENYTLPALVVSDEGGTGKSLFAEKILPTLFGADLVASNVSMEELTGQFTSHLVGKAVVVINENRPDRNDQEAIKRILGSRMIKEERKGVDAKQTANTSLMLVFGNFSLGAIKLAGTEVDRRYSILKNDRPLKSYTAPILQMTEEEAYAWMWSTGQHIVSDPVEVARWIGHLIVKHGDVDHLTALHGQDYLDMLEGQADTAQQVFRAFFFSKAWVEDGYFRQPLMFQYYRDYCKENGMRSMTNQRFYKEAELWAKRNHVAVERRAVVKWGSSTASLFVDPTKMVKATPLNNDEKLQRIDDFDRKRWKIDID